MLVKLASAIDVAAEDVSEVTINCNQRVEVLMRSGRVHTIAADYNSTVYDTHDRIVSLINTARLQRSPFVVVSGGPARELVDLGALLKAGPAPVVRS